MTGELVVLGCAAGAPTAQGAASGYLVRAGGSSVLVDCGPGVVAALAASGLVDELDAVIVTHEHADHCADVVALAFRRAFPRRRAPLPLIGPAGLGAALAALDGVFGIPTLPDLRRPLAEQLPLVEIEPGTSTTVAGLRVDTVRAAHPVPTLSVRFPELGLVYSSDTALTPELTRLADGAGVLLAEATYVDEAGHDFRRHGHMSGAHAGELAARAGAGLLVLTHLSDPGDAGATRARARTRFAGPLAVAQPHAAIPLPGPA